MTVLTSCQSPASSKRKQQGQLAFSKFTFALALSILLVFSQFFPAMAAKKSYSSWQEIANAMQAVLEEAKEEFAKGDKQAAADKVDVAYFSYYETLGFEKNAAAYIKGSRKIANENAKRNARRIALNDGSQADFEAAVDKWIKLLQVDAKVLDGAAASVEEAEALVEQALTAGTDSQQAQQVAPNEAQSNHGQANQPKGRIWSNFVVALGLTLREGLEAILVIVAILAYLDKTKHRQLNKHVYGGMFGGVAVSVVLAILINYLRNFFGDESIGQSQEIFEGVTMLLAVLVLFWVSNWMLSKSDVAAWHKMLQSSVASAITTGSVVALVFSSFLAVAREGAELILFFQVLLTGKLSADYSVWLGLLFGLAILAVIWILFRVYAVRLPLKPFFYFTSALMFVLCFSFTGKGVMELIEGNVVNAHEIAFMNNFSFDHLGIFPYYETLVPQLAIVILTILVVLWQFKRQNKEKARLEAEKPGAIALLTAEEIQEKLAYNQQQRLKLEAQQINAYLAAYQAAKLQGRSDLQTEYKEQLLTYSKEAMQLSQTLPAKVRLDSVEW